MDLAKVILELLGINSVTIEDVKIFKKDLSFEIKIKQKRSEHFWVKCGLQLSKEKEWALRGLKAPPMGINKKVTIKFMQIRGTVLNHGK